MFFEFSKYMICGHILDTVKFVIIISTNMGFRVIISVGIIRGLKTF